MGISNEDQVIVYGREGCCFTPRSEYYRFLHRHPSELQTLFLISFRCHLFASSLVFTQDIWPREGGVDARQSRRLG